MSHLTNPLPARVLHFFVKRKLYRFYQSDKYTQTTATSNKIVVTVMDATFEVKQDTLTKFTINFDNAVSSLGDVTVTRLFETATATYEFPMVVKSAKLNDGNKSATVELFSDLSNNVNYVISVVGYDDYTLTASAGAPADIIVSSSETSVSPFVTAGTPGKLHYTLYDANGVDVTKASKGNVIFSTKEFSTDGSYYVVGEEIWFAKAGISTVVTAKYHSNVFENGEEVGTFERDFDFVGVDATPVTLKSVSATILNKDKEDTKSLEVAKDDTAYLKFSYEMDDNNGAQALENGTEIPNVGKISFEETTPDILALDKSSMALYTFNTGTAVIIVNATTTDSNNNETTTPIGAVTVTVKPARTLSSVTVDKTSVTVGTVDGYDEATINFTAKDQYQADVAINSVVFTGTTDAATTAYNNGGLVLSEDKKSVTIYGAEMAVALEDAKAVNLTYKAKINDSKEVTFSVLVKDVENNTESKTKYISIEANKTVGDVARTVDSTGAKDVTFTVYTMENGVKVGEEAVAKYNATDVANAKAGAYFYKVLKNGTDVTDKVSNNANGSGATISFSGTADVTNGAVSGSAVTYDLGAGNYSFVLYKCVRDGYAVQQQTATAVATCNTGSYGAAVRVKETVTLISDDKNDPENQEAVRKCFKVNNTKGQEATSACYVDMDASATDYVYVKSITFYDDLGDGSYAPYTVNVGVALKKN